MWSAEQRRDRSPLAIERNIEHTSSRVWQFVNEDQSDLTQPTRRRPTDDQKRDRLQLKEKGEACMRCCLEKKICDREDQCWKCRLPQPGPNPKRETTLCFRGVEKLWLWRAVEQPSLEPGSRYEALHRARTTTFADSSQQLRELPRLGQVLPGVNVYPVVYLTSTLDDSTGTSRIVMMPGSFAEPLQSMPDILTKQFKKALAAHIPDLILPSLLNGLTEEEGSLLASAQSAFCVYNFLSSAVRVQYHASPRDISSAREVSCFLMEYCAKLVVTEVEGVLEKLRAIVRRYKSPGQVIKHAFGIYYSILAGLQRWNTESALDIVLAPLTSRAKAVIDDLDLLYRNIYGFKEALHTFVNREINVVETHNLHISHDLLSANDNAVTAWNPLVYNPFQKDFSLLLRDLLVRDGRVTWISNIHLVQQSVLSPEDNDLAETIPLQGGTEANESPDATLLNSFSDDRSTFIQSPTEAEHGAELGRGNQVQVGDDKIPLDIFGITRDSGTLPKRSLSPQSSSSSPPPKRSEHDEWQPGLDTNFFEDAWASVTQAPQLHGF